LESEIKGSRQNERCQRVEESEKTKDGEDKKEDRRCRDREKSKERSFFVVVTSTSMHDASDEIECRTAREKASWCGGLEI